MTSPIDLVRRFLDWGSGSRYLVAGVFTSLLDLTLFSLCSVVLHIPVVPSNVISTTITIIVSYQINRRWVFKTEKTGLVAFFSFASVTLFTGLLLQSGIIWRLNLAFSSWFPTLSGSVAKPASKIVAMAVGAVCNYLAYRFVFRDPAGDVDHDPSA